MVVVCAIALGGVALNVRMPEPTAETTESAVEAFGEQALTVGAPSPLPGPPPAAPHRWTHGSGARRIANPDLDQPDQPPELA